MVRKHLPAYSALVGFSLFISCSGDKPIVPAKDKIIAETVVKTVPVAMADPQGRISALGFVTSESEARPSFKTGGVIQKTYTKEGDYVKKGQLLATLVMDEIEAQVRQAEEALYKAERDMRRIKNLYADSVATLEQFQNVTTAYEVARKTVEIARFNRQYSEVRAPISGKIVKQIMKTGEITGPGTPVCAIMGTGQKDWKIKAGLIDKDWARVRENDKADIYLDAYPGQVFKGKVTAKSSLGGQGNGTFDVDIDFENFPENLAAGLTANVYVYAKSSSNLPVIPIDALVRTDGRKAEIFTIDNGKAKKIEVEIEKISGDKVTVTSGLDGIEKVVTIGAIYLEEGEKIRD